MPKRHASLIQLSRDHHDGLMLALRLRQGKRALLRDWSHDLRWQATYVQQFYRSHLLPHFEAEEKALFPVMKKYARESVDTIETLLKQHEEMKTRVERIGTTSEATLEEALKSFGELLERHIRIEEDELFPTFEKSVPTNVAAEVGRKIEKVDKPLAE